MEDIKLEKLIEVETRRLSYKYGKDFFDYKDLMKITGLGRDNVRSLMNSTGFPITRVGNRKVVSIINFAKWLVIDNNKVRGGYGE
jgi:hypothetical protein